MLQIFHMTLDIVSSESRYRMKILVILKKKKQSMSYISSLRWPYMCMYIYCLGILSCTGKIQSTQIPNESVLHWPFFHSQLCDVLNPMRWDNKWTYSNVLRRAKSSPRSSPFNNLTSEQSTRSTDKIIWTDCIIKNPKEIA